MTTIPDSCRANNSDIFDLVRKTLDISFRGWQWHGKINSESEKLVQNLMGKKIKKGKRKIHFESQKSWAQKFINF